jgi:TFIIF-interacting CTD phosphatase-like protein
LPIKRDLYRAFEKLRAVQSERREREEKLFDCDQMMLNLIEDEPSA